VAGGSRPQAGIHRSKICAIERLLSGFFTMMRDFEPVTAVVDEAARQNGFFGNSKFLFQEGG
jgi:hypothetical protein